MAVASMGKRPRNRTGLTSSKIRHVVSHRETAARGVPPTSEVLGPRKIAQHAASVGTRKKARLAGKNVFFFNILNLDTDGVHT